MNKKVVIIGAVAAGTKTAAKLKRDKPEYEVNLYTEEAVVSYSACGLPYYIEGSVKSIDNLVVRTPEKFIESGVNVFLNRRCTKILPERKEVQFVDVLTNENYVETYDKLLIATGSRPFIPNIKNVCSEGVYTLRTLEDGIRIKEAIKSAKKAVIIGGGYIGVELLEAFVANGLKVVMIEASPCILPIFDVEFSEIIKQHIQRKDGESVGIINNDYVTEIDAEEGKAKGVKTKNGLEISADIVIVAAGVVPNSEIAKDAGLEIGIKNTIRVNKRMQTSEPDIYAAGDCAEKHHLVSKEACWIPLGSTANKEGRVAAINIGGGNEDFAGVLGSAVTRYFGFTMSISGLTERDAKRLGYEVETATVTKKDKAGYMPEVENITIKLVVDAKTRRMLGVQGIGCGDADKRVNSAAAIIQASETIDDFLNIDLTYAPPYSTALDPLHNAAAIIKSKLDRI